VIPRATGTFVRPGQGAGAETMKQTDEALLRDDSGNWFSFCQRPT
jgi:hypothetical protein